MPHTKEQKKEYYLKNKARYADRDKKRDRSKYYQEHKDDILAKSRKWHKDNPEKSKKSSKKYYRKNKKKHAETGKRNYIKKKYGLSWDEYQIMLAVGCSACGSKERLSLDHCHITGKLRGILCSTCNSAAGMVKDNPTILRKLADWLETDKGDK